MKAAILAKENKREREETRFSILQVHQESSTKNLERGINGIVAPLTVSSLVPNEHGIPLSKCVQDFPYTRLDVF